MNDPTLIGESLSAWIDDEPIRQNEDSPTLQTLLAQSGAREQCVLYRTIGDTLREGAAGVRPTRDDFVQAVMSGLAPGAGHGSSAPPKWKATEATPVVVSEPGRARGDARAVEVAEAAEAANEAVFRWRAIAGVACVVAVGTLAWHLLSGDGASQGPVLAEGGRGASRIENMSNTLATPVMIRDPRLDDLIAQHRQAAGVSAFQNGSGFLRAATYEGGGR